MHFREIFAKTAERRQKAHSVSVFRELKQQARDDPNFISNVITGDETWVYGYNPEIKQQSSKWTSPNSRRPKKSASSSLQCQVHVYLSFDMQGTVHKEFVPLGHTINGKSYCEVLKRLREGIRHKRPEKWKNNNWFLHHDKAPAHTSLVVQQFLTSEIITVIPHTSLFAWPRPCDFFLFPKMKLRLKERRFDTTEGIHKESQEVIDTLTFENFQGCMKSWETTLESLYTCPRGLLRRRRWELEVTVRKFCMVKFREFLCNTSYLTFFLCFRFKTFCSFIYIWFVSRLNL